MFSKALFRLAFMLLVASTTLTATITANQPQGPAVCPERCENCLYNSETNKYDCTACLGSQFINKNQCASTPAPAAQNCKTYALDQCLTCSPGYSLQTLTKPINGQTWACRPSLIPKCIQGQIQTNSGDRHTAQNENCLA